MGGRRASVYHLIVDRECHQSLPTNLMMRRGGQTGLEGRHSLPLGKDDRTESSYHLVGKGSSTESRKVSTFQLVGRRG
jgi:hypothetical protein